MQSSVRSQLEVARNLIRRKDYSAARKLLLTIDHPTAQKWLDRLDEVAPLPATHGNRVLIAAIAVLVVLLLGLISLAFVYRHPSSGQSALNGPEATASSVEARSTALLADMDATLETMRVTLEPAMEEALIQYCETIPERTRGACRRWAGIVVSQRLDIAANCYADFDWVRDRYKFDACLLTNGIAVIGDLAIIEPIDLNIILPDDAQILFTRLDVYCSDAKSDEYCRLWSLMTLAQQRPVVDFCERERQRSTAVYAFENCMHDQNVIP